MKVWRKKTFVLLLASVISVACSHAAENYKNSLVGIEFRQASSEIDMVLQTKASYTDTITPRKMDAETYVLILPEVDCTGQTPSLSEVSNSIKSVNIRTMPYSDSNKGYTKVTVKTYGNTNISTKSEVARPKIEKNKPEQLENRNNRINNEEAKQAEEQRQLEIEKRRQEARERANKQLQQKAEEKKMAETNPVPPPKPVEQKPVPNARESVDAANKVADSYTSNSDGFTQNRLIILGVLLAIAISTFFLIRARENMATAAGEQFNIDIDDENKKKKKPKKDEKNKKSIKNTIKKLDSKYSGLKTPPMRSFTGEPVTPVSTVKPSEELNIVDLDALFQEHAKKQGSEISEEENDALEDFLSGFSFDEDLNTAQENEENAGFDEEFYEKLISEKNITFNTNDIECINELLNSEISNDTLKNIEQYAITNPIEKKKPSKQSVLENIVSDYAIKQDILFSKDDISVLKKLMSVELDNDFVTDLRTNPEKTAQMEKEIVKNEGRKYKPSEIITLKVKDFLPNLSDELKAQGNKRIESDYKPETVYFSEGYEVSTLAVNDLPDLSEAIHDKKAYASKPSAAYQITDDSYEMSTLDTSNELPDLKDVLAHPEKYQEKEKEAFVASEESLLNNLTNVSFKPFDKDKDDFEILNKPEDFEAPSVNDIKDELSEFENFVVQDDDTDETVENSNYYDEVLNENAFIDLDNTKENPTDKPTVSDKTGDVSQISVEKENKENTQKSEQKIEQKIDKPKIVEPKISESKITPQIKDKKPVREVKKEVFVPKKLERVVPRVKRDRISNKSDELLKRIEESRAEREAKKLELKLQGKVPALKKYKSEHRVQMLDGLSRCIIEGVNYEILSSVPMEKDCCCYLAKSKNGFAVIGCSGEEYCILKKYEILKTTVIAARLSEKMKDGTLRYFIRVGTNKFIADIKDGNKIRYVMDL